jgi:transposase
MTNSEQRRLTNWRLKVLQTAVGAGNVAPTFRHFGISRKTFYKWRQRYQEHGDAGLADRARAPHHSPRATPTKVVSKILYLRQHYHFGPGEIADYLKRFHSVSVACASVHRILRRHGMNRLPANQKVPTARAPLDALREGATGASPAGRRQVSRAHCRHAPAFLSIHRHRQIAPAFAC